LEVQKLAVKNFTLLRSDPAHPSLHLKRIRGLWSVRVGHGYRALGIPMEAGICWHWIGTHADYDKLVAK
jgi:hypothetical protein